MCWLPLFMGSASAMSLHMALKNQSFNLTSLSHAATQTQNSCHEDNTNINQHKQVKETHQKHQCLACGVCALANASASFDAVPKFDVCSQTSMMPRYFNVAFSSLDHPPAIKPPILN